jgi:hypothetical protein
MKRRILELSLALACAFPALAGCESLRHRLRPDPDVTANIEDEPAEHPEIKSEAPKGFFPNTRLSGAMSDEGRDVEKSLGIE